MIDETRKKIAELEQQLAKLQGVDKEKAQAELKALREQLGREQAEEDERKKAQAGGTSKYIVAGSDLRHNGKLYRENSPVFLTAAEAKKLGKAVQPAK